MIKQLRGSGYLIDSRKDWKQFVVNLRMTGKPTQDWPTPKTFPAIVFAEWRGSKWCLTEFIYPEDFGL